MRPTLALCAAVLCSLAACAQDDATEPSQLPPPGGAVARWSDPRTWPGRTLPVAGADVVIPAGQTVLLDLSPPALRSLTVEGTLRFDARDLALAAGWIMVHGRFEAGSEAAPYRHRAVITLNGPTTDDVMGMGARVFGVMGGVLELHGEPRLAWTRLDATAPAGASQITLARAPDWRPGDRIVVASTDLDPFQAEEAVIAAVQGTTVTLTAPLRFAHFGVRQTYAGRILDTRAEVGLLTRNITIQGDDASLLTQFGGRPT